MPSYREITVGGEGRPRRPAGPAKRAAPLDWRSALRRGLSGALALGRESPGTVLGGVVAVAAAGLVCFNALGHQSGRHPAPILPKVAAKDAAPEPAREPARPVPAAAPKQAARDAIGDLIRSDETTASVTPKAPPPKPLPAREAAKLEAKPEAKPAVKADRSEAADAAVLRVQRALAKLGYGVKADGAMGPGTRAALEKFERDRKLPVTGEGSGRTLHELMARAGQG